MAAYFWRLIVYQNKKITQNRLISHFPISFAQIIMP
jgi:hypothetical protein